MMSSHSKYLYTNRKVCWMPTLNCILFIVAIVVLLIWIAIGLLTIHIVYMCIQSARHISSHFNAVSAIYL